MRIFNSLLLLLFLASGLFAADGSLYDQARELYKQGPSKGPEIVRLLREHVQTNTNDYEAFSLLAITLFGIEKPAEALPVIERAIEIAQEKKEVSPKMLMLKARSLYKLDRNWECRRILEIYSAFWQDKPELKSLYDSYYPRVKDAEEPKKANQPAAPNPAGGSHTIPPPTAPGR